MYRYSALIVAFWIGNLLVHTAAVDILDALLDVDHELNKEAWDMTILVLSGFFAMVILQFIGRLLYNLYCANRKQIKKQLAQSKSN